MVIKKKLNGAHESIIILNPKAENQAICRVTLGGFCPEDCIRLSDQTMKNLKIKAGDMVDIQVCSNIEYG